MITKIVLIVAISAFSATTAVARCGEYFECEAPPEVYTSDDIEGNVEATIDDSFSHCVKISKPLDRLKCYDDAMIDLGYGIAKKE